LHGKLPEDNLQGLRNPLWRQSQSSSNRNKLQYNSEEKKREVMQKSKFEKQAHRSFRTKIEKNRGLRNSERSYWHFEIVNSDENIKNLVLIAYNDGKQSS
jgi:hypothetical protein